MIRAFLPLFGLLALVAIAPSQAQVPAQTPPQTPAQTLAELPPATASPAITPDQARAALDVLNDPAKRAAFTATLEALLKAPTGQTAAAPPTAAAKPSPLPIPLTPNSLGAQVLLTASEFLAGAATRLRDGVDAIQSIPLLWDWVTMMVASRDGQAILLDLAWRLALGLLAASALELLLRWSLRRPVIRLESAASALAPVPVDTGEPPTSEDGEARGEAGEYEGRTEQPGRPRLRHRLRCIGITLARMLLVLLPLVGFLVVGHLFAGSTLGGEADTSLVLLAVFDAYALCAAAIRLTRIVLAPADRALRLVPLGDGAVTYLMRWFHVLIVLVVFGYAFAEVGRLLGMSDLAHAALLKTDGLLASIGLAFMIMRVRRPVRRLLRGSAEATGFAHAVRDRAAAVWHWIALFLLFAFWLVWAINLRAGSRAVLHYFILTLLVFVAARLLIAAVLGLIDQVPNIDERTATRYPGLQGRLRLYHPLLAGLARGAIQALAIAALLQVYGIDALTWLVSSVAGERVVSGLVTLVVTVAAAFVVWELANASIHHHLSRVEAGDKAAKAARLRTLLPLLRSTLLITIIVVAGLMVLSEIGVNIGPLLAGAGIIGVAIGFGSQKLVQDLITGVFLLLENAMQVGDAVTVSGLSGVVEALSVRTIRLRAGDGSVHIIPFSAVTSVTNLNRGLGNAEVRVTVEFDQDIDRVMQLLKDIVADMRGDPALAPGILSDLQLWGVDRVDGAGVTVAGQVVCTDSARWPVQREFNRRMKRVFQEEGIHLLNPSRTIAVPGPLWNAAPSEASHGPTG